MHRDDALAGFFPRDIIDQEIHQICESWPTILEDNTIIRKSQGRYRINGREVSISLVTHEGKDEEDGREGLPRCSPDVVSLKEITTSLGGNPDDLIVRDGPLTQPFLDYVFDTGEKESYAMEISADGRSSMPLASDMKGGQLVADPGDRLEAMSIALNSVETPDPMMALGELPTMPLPPQLPRSSEPAQPAAGVHLSHTAGPLCISEHTSSRVTLQAESVVEIIMDLPIVMETSSFACHASLSLCAPEACSIPANTAIIQPNVMGPRFSSTAKPTAAGEADPSPWHVGPGQNNHTFSSSAVEEVTPVLCPNSAKALSADAPGGKRRHRFSEVIMPGELEAREAKVAVAKVRSKVDLPERHQQDRKSVV